MEGGGVSKRLSLSQAGNVCGSDLTPSTSR